MITLASTAIPIVRTIPAKPGNVNTVLIEESTPKINIKFVNDKPILNNVEGCRLSLEKNTIITLK